MKDLESLAKEIDNVDDWANGIYMALFDLLVELSKENPQLLKRLELLWEKAASDYEKADAGEKTEVPLYQLEARKMLYKTLKVLGCFPE